MGEAVLNAFQKKDWETYSLDIKHSEIANKSYSFDHVQAKADYSGSVKATVEAMEQDKVSFDAVVCAAGGWAGMRLLVDTPQVQDFYVAVARRLLAAPHMSKAASKTVLAIVRRFQAAEEQGWLAEQDDTPNFVRMSEQWRVHLPCAVATACFRCDGVENLSLVLW